MQLQVKLRITDSPCQPPGDQDEDSCKQSYFPPSSMSTDMPQISQEIRRLCLHLSGER